MRVSGTNSVLSNLSGWAQNGAMKNVKTFYSYVLPLGEDFGRLLFFSHYSFLGLNPNKLKDAYADYKQQNTNHTLINYSYCKTNPRQWYGYSNSVWGLTASNIKNGYTASSPLNDVGHIAPTAALAIDQGPIIVMIENYRTGLLWNLFMNCDEVQAGLNKLGFMY